MATQHPSPAPRAPAASRPYPMADPGYGKRSAPGQHPRPAQTTSRSCRRGSGTSPDSSTSFPRARAMDVKSLAKPPALRTAGRLQRVERPRGRRSPAPCALPGRRGRAGPLGLPYLLVPYGPRQRVVGHVPGRRGQQLPAGIDARSPGCRRRCRGPAPAPTAPGSAPSVVPEQRTQATPAIAASPAYLTLAQLGRRDTRLALSAADCRTWSPWLPAGSHAVWMPTTSPRRSPQVSPRRSAPPWASYAAASPTNCRRSWPAARPPPRQPRRSAASSRSAPNAAAPALPKRSPTASAAPAAPHRRRCQPLPLRNATSTHWSDSYAT